MTVKNIAASISSTYVMLVFFILLAAIFWFDPTLLIASGWRRPGAAAARIEALRLAQVASNRQARLVEGAQQLLVGLAQLPVVRRGDAAACSASLSDLLQRTPGYVNLGAIGPNGQLLCSAVPISDPDNFVNRPDFQHTIHTRGFTFGEYQIDRRTKQAIMTLAYPVLDATGRVHAVVFAVVDLAWISGLLVEAGLPQGSAIVVMDQDGMILAREPDPERWVGKSALTARIFRTILDQQRLRPTLDQQREGTTEGTGLDGVRRLFGYRPLIRSFGAGETYVIVTIPRLLAREVVGLGLAAAVIIAATWIGSDLVLRRRVKTLVGAAERLRLGDLSARTGLSYGTGRMGRLALAFDEMATALEARRSEAERAEAAQRRLNEALEREARRIAHALHDEAGQLLAVVYIGLEDCARDLPPAAYERLQEVKGHLDQVEEQLRRLSHELRPTILDNLGVVPALNFLAEGVSKRTGLAITVEGSTGGRLPVGVETAIYRVVQESLANATRHAKATHVRIELQREDQQIRCAIMDNGIGFDLPAVLAEKGDRGLGLIGMQERLKILDGRLQITSDHGQGTALLVTIPLGA